MKRKRRREKGSRGEKKENENKVLSLLVLKPILLLFENLG